VGLSFPGGGRLVYLGSQRIAEAVVSCEATVNGEGGAVDEWEGFVGREVGGCAVLKWAL
jgi:hypothetical protein